MLSASTLRPWGWGQASSLLPQTWGVRPPEPLSDSGNQSLEFPLSETRVYIPNTSVLRLGLGQTLPPATCHTPEPQRTPDLLQCPAPGFQGVQAFPQLLPRPPELQGPVGHSRVQGLSCLVPGMVLPRWKRWGEEERPGRRTWEYVQAQSGKQEGLELGPPLGWAWDTG